jgi:D-cysteine desulfhydrase
MNIRQIEELGPPRIDLARTPTPLEPLCRWSEKTGALLYVKRDDLTGAGLMGNKVRKLEYAMAAALAEDADTVLTCGGAQSNHSRATAIAAARLGLKCRLLLRTPDPQNPPPLEANSLLDRLVGAEITWITPDDYKNRNTLLAEQADKVRKTGGRPYIIPEGASNPIGAWGYIRAAAELASQLGEMNVDTPVTIVHATGSGGTAAGLILGVKLSGLNARVTGVNVCDDRSYFIKVIGDICDQTIADYRLNVSLNRDTDVEIIDGYVGRGYALSQPVELELIRDVARAEGIILDPVYTGKAFFGLTRELEKDRDCLGPRIVFIHTGGMFGLFAKTSELIPLLE